jgi:hypothetical protein
MMQSLKAIYNCIFAALRSQILECNFKKEHLNFIRDKTASLEKTSIISGRNSPKLILEIVGKNIQ